MQTLQKITPNEVKFNRGTLPDYRIIRTRESSTFNDIPRQELYRRAVKLQMVGALVWDYTDTILDQAIQMRISATKKLSREVRQLKIDYFRVLNTDLDSEHVARLTELSELFEDINREHFRKLHFGLQSELGKSELSPEYLMLVESVQMAMAVIDAIYIFAADCDNFIAQYYPSAPSTILPLQIRKLKLLLPSFAGDSYVADSPTRKLTAKILANEINRIDLYDEYGKI